MARGVSRPCLIGCGVFFYVIQTSFGLILDEQDSRLGFYFDTMQDEMSRIHFDWLACMAMIPHKNLAGKKNRSP